MLIETIPRLKVCGTKVHLGPMKKQPKQICLAIASGIQPTEKKTDKEITQKDTAAKGVSPKEVGNAEGGKPIDADQKSQSTWRLKVKHQA